jgi:broad specificity phosphatase PhoE
VSKLILIRHSLPAIDYARRPDEWLLSEEGRQRCQRLAASLAPYSLYILVSSHEPKAIQTAELTAAILGVPFKPAAGLHEHLRDDAVRMSEEEFGKKIRLLFDRRDEVTFGKESANGALSRFSAAVADVLNQYPEDVPIGLVTHGTVLALYVAAIAQIEPYEYWRQLDLPAFVVIDRDRAVVEATVPRVM